MSFWLFVMTMNIFHPNHFLKNLSRYAKDTIICMDRDFKAKIDGIGLAKQLKDCNTNTNRNNLDNYFCLIMKI
jgi:hypothetical protein